MALFDLEQQFVFRCLVAGGVVDVVAENEAEAKELSGSEMVRKLCKHPVAKLEDVREQWKDGCKDKKWLLETMDWAVAAIRLGVIDDEKFNEIEKSVNAAIHRLEASSR